MLQLSPTIRSLLGNAGPFVGLWKAQSRLTVDLTPWPAQPDWVDGFRLVQSVGPVGNFPSPKLPIRWWQREDNSQIEVEIPNIKSVQIVTDLSQQAATLVATIYNVAMDPNGVMGASPVQLGEPGFFSWTYGSTAEARSRWGQVPNAWAGVLTENALIRVYQGYGGQGMSIPQAVEAGLLYLTGTFLLDDPAIESNGITTLNGRDMMKLGIDQQTVPPLIPTARYPLNYYGPGQNTATLGAVPGYGTGSWLQQRAILGSTSDTTPQATKAALLALDGNDRTAWRSNNGGSVTGQVWYQLDCQEEVTGVYLNPMYGNYICFVSILVNGVWQGSGDVGGIPYVTHFGVPFERAQWVTLPGRYQASQVRLTFTNLFAIDGGFYAFIREIQLGSTGIVTGSEKYASKAGVFAATQKIVLDLSPTPNGAGYRIFGSDGGVFDFGNAIFYGSRAGHALNAGIVGGAGTPSGKGYWLCGADGGIFTYGDAGFFGSHGGSALSAPIVAFCPTPTGLGYYLMGNDGGVFTYGDAVFHGSGVGTGEFSFVDMALNPAGTGYWLFGEDGNVFSFGAVAYHGAGPTTDLDGLPNLYVGIDSTASGAGYWLLTAAGSVYPLGDAVAHGGFFPAIPNAPFSGIRRTPSGGGYWLVGQDGGVFTYGNGVFYGSLPGIFTYALPADYSDYADIIKDLALWCGFWLYPPSGQPTAGQPPAVYGNIESTGAYNSLGPMGIDFYDKRPVCDVMSDIAKTIGYLLRVDSAGGLHFEPPNYWVPGNRYEDTGALTDYIPVVDEKINLTDYTMTQTDQELRSPLLVTVSDPYLDGGPIAGTNVTTFIPPYTPRLRGIIKSASYGVPLQVGAEDQQYFAELLAVRIWLQSRTGSLTAWCDPSVTVDTQVQIFERNSAETNCHYVTANTTNHDCDTGLFTMQLTTYWLGGRTNWAITSNKVDFFGPGATQPVTVTASAVATVYDAPSATTNLTTSTAHAGYQGKGYLENFDANDDFITFKVTSTVAGQYLLNFLYASPAGCTVGLIVNGTVLGNQTFAPTTGFTDWESVGMTLTLQAGTNTINFLFDSPTGSAGSMNVNSLTLEVPPDDLNFTLSLAATEKLINTGSPSTQALMGS